MRDAVVAGGTNRRLGDDAIEFIAIEVREIDQDPETTQKNLIQFNLGRECGERLTPQVELKVFKVSLGGDQILINHPLSDGRRSTSAVGQLLQHNFQILLDPL
jgi:hypothetical protein